MVFYREGVVGDDGELCGRKDLSMMHLGWTGCGSLVNERDVVLKDDIFKIIRQILVTFGP